MLSRNKKSFTRKIILCIFISIVAEINSQNSIVKGVVIDGSSKNPLENVFVSIKKIVTKKTDDQGVFIFRNLTKGAFVLTIALEGYEAQHLPIELADKTIDLGLILLYQTIPEDKDISIITISDDDLNDDTKDIDNIPGLLQSSRDIFLKIAAFEFSPSFFKIRGLDSENNKILINEITMNKLYNGRPQWSNWGGLNDVLRNVESTTGLGPSTHTFGGILGNTHIRVNATEQVPSSKISYAFSNRSYTHRIMASHSSGISKKGWAYTIAASRRAANQGYIEGTLYNANSFFVSIGKKIATNHLLHFTTIAAFNKRGKSSPQTKEVFDLKGIRYNSYWGFQNNKIRNSRIKRISEPVFMLNYDWHLNKKTFFNTNISYQLGQIGNSRLEYNGSRVETSVLDGNGNPFIVGLGGANPMPTYYKKLPSYGIREGYTNVYEMEQDFLRNGQLDWNSLYSANAQNKGNATYILYEDRNDDKQITINSLVEKEFSKNISLNGRVQYTHLESANFAELTDLLGGTGYLDVDSYANSFDEKQNNLLNPLHITEVGEKFKYNYKLYSSVLDGFIQGQFKYNKIDFHLAITTSKTAHQRKGLFQNGTFKNNSLGKSEKATFINFGAKGGLSYRFSGRHFLDINAGYLTTAPNLRNTFSNARENNSIVDDLTSKKYISGEISYIFRNAIIQAKTTGFYTKIQDATEISFFYADGIGGDNATFVQEVLSGIDKKHFGLEVGIEAQITSTIKLKSAANIGQYTYDNNPNLYLTTENNITSQNAGFVNGQKNLGITNLKNYKLAVGPQRAYAVGFEYRDPEYWFIGTTVNFFDKIYIDISPLRRSSNFVDNGGIPFNDYNPEVAKKLLQQEKFDSYTTVNMIGGKSWKVGKRYIGFFASIGNVLNTHYKSGGFEQGRNANYRQLKKDNELAIPVFGNKYWYGRGTTYFFNVNYKF